MATAINWPFAGKYWLRDGYGYARANLLSEMATRRGRAVLRIGTTGPSNFTASVLLTGAELALFDGWLQYELLAGALWFNAMVQASGTLEMREIRFLAVSQPTQIVGADHWTVTADFETRVGTQMDAETYAALQEYGGVDEYSAFIDEFNIFAEQEMPAPTFKEEA
jgi:hypothetical protein